MIDMSQATKKRGRPPKKKLSEEMAELRASRAQEGEEQAERLQQLPEKEGPFVFKSKYREDIVTLVTPRKIKHADGSTFIDPGKFAEFHRNTWTTHDPYEAQLLREKIEARRDTDPLHIVETTI